MKIVEFMKLGDAPTSLVATFEEMYPDAQLPESLNEHIRAAKAEGKGFAVECLLRRYSDQLFRTATAKAFKEFFDNWPFQKP